MQTIRSRAEIDDLFKHGNRFTTSLVTLIVRKSPEARGAEGRVLFVAGRKCGGAVARNRCKRVLRESVLRCGGPWPGWDVALMARRETGAAAPCDLDRAMMDALRRSRVVT